MSALRITEIFHSLQGESRPVGYPTAFIRLTGCPLRCGYCDTAYAFHGGQKLAIAEIMGHIVPFQVRHVCVTGGEPLAQPACLELLTTLCDARYQVSLETSGALDIAAVDRRVAVVLDLKTPASGECARNLWSNLPLLKRDDQVKFVICGRGDYDWAVDKLRQHDLSSCCEVLFSPAWEQQPATELAEWILADRLPVRFQVQLHKYLWGTEPGH